MRKNIEKKTELDKRWDKAACPHMSDISGRFRVKILSGAFRLYAPLVNTWQKMIHRQVGCNIINGKSTGTFSLRPGGGAMFLDYHKNQKPWYWTRLVDEIRMEEKGEFLGRIWFSILNKGRFMGYFSLTETWAHSLVDLQELVFWRKKDAMLLVTYLSQAWDDTTGGYVSMDNETLILDTGHKLSNNQLVESLKQNKEIWPLCFVKYPSKGFYKLRFSYHLLR